MWSSQRVEDASVCKEEAMLDLLNYRQSCCIQAMFVCVQWLQNYVHFIFSVILFEANLSRMTTLC